MTGGQRDVFPRSEADDEAAVLAQRTLLVIDDVMARREREARRERQVRSFVRCLSGRGA